MKKASWMVLAAVGAVTLLGSLGSLAVAYGTERDQIGPLTLRELSAGMPDVATAIRARRATAAAYAAGFAILFLAIVLGPYRRGEVWAWWALLGGMLTVTILVLLRHLFLGVPLGDPLAATGASTTISSSVQLLVVSLGLGLDSGRLRRPGPRT
jgi:hypothetical protein